MVQRLSRLSKLFRDAVPAQPHADPDGDPTGWNSPISPSLILRVICLIGFVWVLGLGLASIAANFAAQEQESPPDGPDTAATAVITPSGFPVHVARWRSGSTHRSHKRLLVVPKIVLSNDPSDDGTSGDPDEDDDNETSKFLNGPDDTDVPIMAWCQEMAPCSVLRECAPLTWISPSSSSLPMLQRLRC